MKTKSIFLIAILCFLALSGCTTPNAAPEATPTTAPAQPVELNVFAAASLTSALTEIGQAFEAEHPGVSVAFNFAGSQELVQQINEGAPADVFASANQKQMDAAIASNRIISGTAQVFARNRLVVIVPADNPANITNLAGLAQPGIKLVLADKSVPVGQYALDFLDKAANDPAFGSDFPASVQASVVSYETNVKSVLSKVALGEADAGIVYISDVGGENAAKVSRIEIPDALNVLAAYPIAALQDSPQPDLARSFVAFVLSEQGQNILEKYGLIPIQ